MAIAETELKKSDADDTSTARSKTFTSESKSPTANKEHPGSSSAKMYRLYSNLKGFAFCMPDGWDDRNISIFLECCKECIEDFQVHRGNDENKIWHKIAKLGAEKSGSTTCFTVNSCLELAQCLKGYVLKNEKRIDNEAFKILYDDIIDLLQYFPTPAEILNKNVRHRSRSKSTEKKGDVFGKNISSVESESSALSQKDHRIHQNVSSHQIENLIITYCQQNVDLFGKQKTPVTYIWKNVSQKIYDSIGTKVDVKKELEKIKRNIAKQVKKEADKKSKEKKFLLLAHDYLQFFDYIPPRTIKKKDFLSGMDYLKIDKLEHGGELGSLKGDSSTPANDPPLDVEYIHKKRRFSKTADVKTGIKNDISTDESQDLKTTKEPPELSNLPSENIVSETAQSSDEVCGSNLIKAHSEKSGDSLHDFNKQDRIQEDSNTFKGNGNQGGSNSEDVISSTPQISQQDQFQFPDSSLVFPSKNAYTNVNKSKSRAENKVTESTDTDSAEANNISSSVLSDHNVTTTTTWVKDITSPSSPGSDRQSKNKASVPNRSNYSSSCDRLKLEEDPEAVFFETKYTLRGLRDNVKCYKPRPKKPRKTGPKSPRKVENIEKRVLPQRSVKRKTTNYNISEEEKSPPPAANIKKVLNTSPKRCPTPVLKSVPESSSLSPISPVFSPISKLKRGVVPGKTMDSTCDEESLTNKKRLVNSDTILHVPKKRNVQQRIKTPESNDQLDKKNVEVTKPNEVQRTESVEDETPYLERVYGLRRMPNVGQEEEALSPSSKKNPVVILEHMQQVSATDNRPPVISFRSQLETSRFSMKVHPEHRQNATLVKPSIVGHSSLTGIAARNSVCHSPDAGRLAHQENMEIPQPHQPSQPSSSSSHFHSRNATNPTSLKSSNHLKEQVNMLEDMDSSTLAILERYKNRVTESTQSKVMMQLVPSGQGTVNKSTAMCKAMHASTGQSAAMEVISSPPEWFGNFVNDYKKHEMWKMSQILKMQQELVDMENKKLAVLEKILGTLKKDNS